MTDQELFKHVNNELYKTGSCIMNEWKLIRIADDEKVLMFEAMQPSRGNIRIRKPFKKAGLNGYGEETYYYNVYKFTNKSELKDEGIMQDTRPTTKEAIT